MNIIVKKLRSKKITKIVTSAVYFYAHLLMSKRICRSLDISITFGKPDNGMLGTCLYVDFSNGIRSFDIDIVKGLTLNSTLSTLAHEMVHLKQFAKKELSDQYHSSKSKWMGKLIDESKVDYWDLPYEIEAYGREPGLFIRFNDREKINQDLLQRVVT